MKRPVIGVSCPWSVETWEDSLESGGYFYVGRPYVEALHKYGAAPILIPPEYTKESLDEYVKTILDVVDGLLFSGGGDVKKEYPEGLPSLEEQQPIRYRFEKKLMEKACEREIPIMGICRGFQMIIEVFGGSLSHEIIDNHKQNISGANPWHEVQINEDSKLYSVIARDTWDVNSFHIQKVGEMPEDFIISAKANDGVVEGIESLNYPFLIGFQFHPEELSWKDELAGKIFTLFIEETKKK